MRVAVVTVQVSSADGLLNPASSKRAAPFPYVVLRLGRVSRRSKVSRPPGSVVWNEVLELTGEESLLAEALVVSVYDRDMFNPTADALIGSAEVPIDRSRTATTQSLDCIELSPTGMIRLCIRAKVVQASGLKLLERQMKNSSDSIARGAQAGVQATATAVKATATAVASASQKMIKTSEAMTATAVEATLTAPRTFIARKTDELTEVVTVFLLSRLLDRLGGLVREALKDPEMPTRIQDLVDRTTTAVWADLSAQVQDSVSASFDQENLAYKEMLIRFRAGGPSLWPRGTRWPQPWTWFRARLLHTLMPSDETFWSAFHDPVAWTIRLLMVLPGISVLLMVVLFGAIRKRDEFQLINYITLVRSYQALLVGVSGLIGGGVQFYSCLRVLDRSLHVPSLATRHPPAGRVSDVGAVAGVDAAAQLAHVTAAFATIEAGCAGHSAAYEWRDWLHMAVYAACAFNLCVYAAYALLIGGYARGGKEHLLALERVRLDAADGTMDGLLDVESAYKLQARLVDDVKDNDPEPVPEHLLWAAAEAERMQLPPRYGLHMRWFIVWDMGVFLGLALWSCPGMPLSWMSQAEHEWMVWRDLYYANILHSLLMTPFVALSLPVVSTMITDAAPTGYDKAGNLSAMLTPAMMERKREHQKEVRDGKHAKRGANVQQESSDSVQRVRAVTRRREKVRSMASEAVEG